MISVYGQVFLCRTEDLSRFEMEVSLYFTNAVCFILWNSSRLFFFRFLSIRRWRLIPRNFFTWLRPDDKDYLLSSFFRSSSFWSLDTNRVVKGTPGTKLWVGLAKLRETPLRTVPGSPQSSVGSPVFVELLSSERIGPSSCESDYFIKWVPWSPDLTPPTPPTCWRWCT